MFCILFQETMAMTGLTNSDFSAMKLLMIILQSNETFGRGIEWAIQSTLLHYFPRG